MKDFELPVLDAYAPIAAAFSVMDAAESAGVVIKSGPKFKIVDLGALLHAQAIRLGSLHEVEPAASVHRVVLAESQTAELDVSNPWQSSLRWEQFLDQKQLRFAILGESLGMARLVSRHETDAFPYLAFPRYFKCSNRPPHRFATSPGPTCPDDGSLIL